ncbi:alpha/beta fold hydrolase [Nonomuraea maheshkhaliensis]|uniref:alpha/beta fold hydrolase n=1 Tax=Nonomuraea maheshkhaliensis TaxID=419590 RepID=UPI003D157311
MAAPSALGLSRSLGRVIGPGPDRGVGREGGLRLGSGVVPAYVAGDRGALLGVASVVGAAPVGAAPVVLIAGGAQWQYSCRDAIPALARNPTVYAVDLPSQGYTRAARNFTYTIPAMADAIRAFLDATGLTKASLVGHSWGRCVDALLRRAPPGAGRQERARRRSGPGDPAPHRVPHRLNGPHGRPPGINRLACPR